MPLIAGPNQSAVSGVTTTSAQFTFTMQQDVQYQLSSAAPIWFAVGANPTAVPRTTGSVYVPPNVPALITGKDALPKIAVILDSAGAQPQIDPQFETNVPATSSALTIFTGNGILMSAVVTATGSTALTFQDAAGNIIGEVLSTATVGQEITFNMPFNTSLIANKSTTTPVVTVAYAAAVNFASICVYS